MKVTQDHITPDTKMGANLVVGGALTDSTFWSYDLGFPKAGQWLEVFNSDVYENWVNPWTAGNQGSVIAGGAARHGFRSSASIVIPANSIIVFATDDGD